MEALEGWSEFNVAIAGAAAALAGLIIVALSVNIKVVLSNRTLPARAAASIGSLIVAVLACGLGLVPDQPVWLLGVELAVPVIITLLLTISAIRHIATEPNIGAGTRFSKALPIIVPQLLFVVGTVLLVLGVAGGFGVIAAGSLSSIAGGVLYAWVALVEVLR